MNPEEQNNNQTAPNNYESVPGQVIQPAFQQSTPTTQEQAPPQPATANLSAPQQPMQPQPQTYNSQTAINNPDTPAQNSVSMTPKKSPKFKIIILVVVILILVVGGLVFAATSKKDSKTSSRSQSPALVTDASDPESTTDAKNSESNEPAAQAEVAVNKVIATDLGKTITVLKAVRNFPDSDLEDNEEGVLVEVKVETDGTYTGTPGESDFRLVIDGKEYKTAYLISDPDIKAGGFSPYGSPSVKKGQPVSGFVAFAITKNSKTITFRYHRGETKIIGGDKLPAKDFDVVIVE